MSRSKMFQEAKAIIKEDACMKFYDETKPLYIETDVSGIGLGEALLQTRDNMTFHRDDVPDNSILRPMHQQRPHRDREEIQQF